MVRTKASVPRRRSRGLDSAKKLSDTPDTPVPALGHGQKVSQPTLKPNYHSTPLDRDRETRLSSPSSSQGNLAPSRLRYDSNSASSSPRASSSPLSGSTSSHSSRPDKVPRGSMRGGGGNTNNNAGRSGSHRPSVQNTASSRGQSRARPADRSKARPAGPSRARSTGRSGAQPADQRGARPAGQSGARPADQRGARGTPGGQGQRTSGSPRSGANKRKGTNPKRRAPGVAALKEIKMLQKTTHLLIRKAPFQRVVKDIIDSVSGARRGRPQLRCQADALMALQEMSEQFLVNMFESMNLIANHSKRVTVLPRDLGLLKRLLPECYGTT